ncbi:hypothetical protein, partial [Lishizhenia sp.]|uniref:hypothetical protein n=1 Tax=Lishizhenia sp. TaxID=2497594 RepID=UPI00299DC4C8
TISTSGIFLKRLHDSYFEMMKTGAKLSELRERYLVHDMKREFPKMLYKNTLDNIPFERNFESYLRFNNIISYRKIKEKMNRYLLIDIYPYLSQRNENLLREVKQFSEFQNSVPPFLE